MTINHNPLRKAQYHEAAACSLVEEKAKVPAIDEHRMSPLHRAPKNRHEAIATLITEKGAEDSAAGKEGRRHCVRGAPWLCCNCLAAHVDRSRHHFFAPRKKYLAVARLLVNKGAGPLVVGEDGRMAPYLAREDGHESVGQLLIGKGMVIPTAGKKEATPMGFSVPTSETILQLLEFSFAEVTILILALCSYE